MTEAIAKELRELNDFIHQYSHLMMITNRLQRINQFLMALLEHVKAQLDMLSLGHLSLSVISSCRLRRLLLEI